MKIKAIEAIIKANKTIVIIKEDGCQWLGNGSALYPLYDFPKMNQQNIFAMFDIPEDKREKYAYRESTGETLSSRFSDCPCSSTAPSRGSSTHRRAQCLSTRDISNRSATTA